MLTDPDCRTYEPDNRRVNSVFLNGHDTSPPLYVRFVISLLRMNSRCDVYTIKIQCHSELHVTRNKGLR